MNALLTALHQHFCESQQQRDHLAALQEIWPRPQDPMWRFTPLALLAQQHVRPLLKPVIPPDPLVIGPMDAPRIVFVDGQYSSSLSQGLDRLTGLVVSPRSTLTLTDPLVAGDRPSTACASETIFTKINTLLAHEGVVIEVASQTIVPEPIHLVFLATSDQQDLAWHHQHCIRLGIGAQLQLVEHHLDTGANASLHNTRTIIHCESQSQLTHVRLQAQSPRAMSLLRTDVTLDAQSHYHRVDIESGGRVCRHEAEIRLRGANAQLTANGVLLGQGQNQIDTQLIIHHLVEQTRSSLNWRGLGTQHSRVAFSGSIHIHEQAQQTQAQLSNQNLLINPTAEIVSQPILVIAADDVKAAHGSTVGQLDQQAMFYLRTRGIAFDQARRMLSAAFCYHPLADLEQGLARIASDRLDRTLHEMEFA